MTTTPLNPRYVTNTASDITTTTGGGYTYTYTITLPNSYLYTTGGGGGGSAGTNYGWATYEFPPITITVDGETHSYTRTEAEDILKWHHRLFTLMEEQPAVGDAYERLLAVMKLVSENNNETE